MELTKEEMSLISYWQEDDYYCQDKEHVYKDMEKLPGEGTNITTDIKEVETK